MFKSYSLAFFLILSLIFLTNVGVDAQTENQNLQTVVHLLGYVARDYPNAVKDQKVIDSSEYKEQIEFVRQISQLTKEVDPSVLNLSAIDSDLHSLNLVVNQKKKPILIANLAQKIQNNIIRITGIRTAPPQWPNQKNGERLYKVNCVSCHGIKGNGKGPLAANLNPQPANFLSVELMQNISPFQTYNTIKLGVEGTSMPSFSQLGEKEMWDVAFYVKSLRFRQKYIDTNKLRVIFNNVKQKLSLPVIATFSDIRLNDTLKKFYKSPKNALIALRSLTPTGNIVPQSLNLANAKLNSAFSAYQKGEKKKARSFALSAYLDGIEPVEAQLRTIDSRFVSSLEGKMFAVRQVIENDGSVADLKIAVNQAKTKINEAKNMLGGQHLNYWLTFVIAASIFLREGLEAFLVLAVVLALIRSSNSRKALPWLHGGWIMAVFLGVIGWFLSDYIIKFGGKNREIMEGLVSILAVIILVVVGFWLHKNTEAKKWQAFVNDRIGGYLKKDRMLGLAAFSFMVVFREAFEVILFLQAINLEASPQNKSAIGLGVLAAVFCIALIAYLFLTYAKKIPVRQLFLYSSWIIILLAVILIGKGIHALQESGWVSVRGIGSFQLEWLGIYPTVETILGQVGLVLIIAGTFFFKRKEIIKGN